jgi:hypothetical protein
MKMNMISKAPIYVADNKQIAPTYVNCTAAIAGAMAEEKAIVETIKKNFFNKLAPHGVIYEQDIIDVLCNRAKLDAMITQIKGQSRALRLWIDTLLFNCLEDVKLLNYQIGDGSTIQSHWKGMSASADTIVKLLEEARDYPDSCRDDNLVARIKENAEDIISGEFPITEQNMELILKINELTDDQKPDWLRLIPPALLPALQMLLRAVRVVR